MRFDEPLWALALVALPLLGWGAFLWQAKRAEAMRALSRHAEGVPPRSRWQLGLLLVALACGVFGLCGPRWGTSQEKAVSRSRNVLLVVDVSRSMLAEDVHPNRLGRAKADLIDLIDELEGDCAGVMAFRGKGVLLCPLTHDVAFLRQSIDGLAPDVAPPGETDIADALAKALSVFKATSFGHNAIVLISDGEDLAGRAKALAEEAGKQHIPIFTVGIGSKEGSVIPDGDSSLTHEGQTVNTQLTEATLQAIASLSGGRYIPLATAGTAQTTLGAVYRRYLTRLEAADHEEAYAERMADRSTLFFVAGAALAIAAGSLSLGRVAAMLVLLLLPGVICAQEHARKAQAAWEREDYKAAAASYAEARVGAEPSEAARYAYNEALALWKENQLSEALEVLPLAYADPAFTLRASELEGRLTLLLAAKEEDLEKRLKARERAIAAFTRAARIEPSERTQRNLYRALDGIELLRRDVRKHLALKRYEKTPLGQLIPEILQKQRSLLENAPEVFTLNDPEVRIAQAERLAKDVREQADRWYPVLEQLPQAIEDEKMREELLQRMQAEQAALDHATAQYENVQSELAPLQTGEQFAYDVWKLVADPPALNAESLALQQHAVKSSTPYIGTRDNHAELFSLLQQFRMVFPQWAEEQLKQQAQQPPVEGEAEKTGETPPPAFTQADRDAILRIAADTVPLFSGEQTQEIKEKILKNLEEIRDHLPKNNQNQLQQNQDSQQQQNQSQDQNQSQSQNQDPSPQEAPEEQAPTEDEAREEDQQATLQKAVDREQEHEEEKRARARQAVPPSARDW